MNQSIFGSAAPKFVYDLGGENETIVLLNYWVTTIDEPDSRELVHESEIEPDRDIIDRGDFWIYEGRINLYKYSSMTFIRSKFEEIYQFNKKKVTLFRHQDGEPFKDASGNNLLFYMKVTPTFLTTLDFRDILIVNFRSLGAVNHSDGSEILTQPSEIVATDDFIVDI